MRNILRLYLQSYKGLSTSAWILALIMLINRSGAMVIPFLGVYLTQALHFTLKDTGIILGCFGIGSVCGSWLGGWLTDKAGHFKVQLFCLMLCVPVLCILPELRTAYELSVGVFFLGLITETFRPANSVSMASYTNPENLTKAFSLNRMAINLGFSIGPALGGFLAGFSYQSLFYCNALSSAVAALVFFFYFRKRESVTQDIKPVAAASVIEDKSPMKDRHFIYFTFFCGLYGICFFQLLNTIPLFYRSVHQLSEWNIGLIISYSGFIVFSLEMLLVHFAERRFRASTVIIAGTILCAASFFMLLLPGKYLVLYASMFILCISEILAMPFMATVTMQRASTTKQGAYMGMNAIAFSAAHILSPVLGTHIAEYYGFGVLWISTGILCSLTAMGFWWIMNRMRVKPA
ncbi:MAG: MFS transporter [Sphingobacteriaceae bacterium]|nr:MFS transporter [Sphingobacteriaceae bacterium]